MQKESKQPKTVLDTIAERKNRETKEKRASPNPIAVAMFKSGLRITHIFLHRRYISLFSGICKYTYYNLSHHNFLFGSQLSRHKTKIMWLQFYKFNICVIDNVHIRRLGYGFIQFNSHMEILCSSVCVYVRVVRYRRLDHPIWYFGIICEEKEEEAAINEKIPKNSSTGGLLANLLMSLYKLPSSLIHTCIEKCKPVAKWEQIFRTIFFPSFFSTSQSSYSSNIYLNISILWKI